MSPAQQCSFSSTHLQMPTIPQEGRVSNNTGPTAKFRGLSHCSSEKALHGPQLLWNCFLPAVFSCPNPLASEKPISHALLPYLRQLSPPARIGPSTSLAAGPQGASSSALRDRWVPAFHWVGITEWIHRRWLPSVLKAWQPTYNTAFL